MSSTFTVTISRVHAYQLDRSDVSDPDGPMADDALFKLSHNDQELNRLFGFYAKWGSHTMAPVSHPDLSKMLLEGSVYECRITNIDSRPTIAAAAVKCYTWPIFVGSEAVIKDISEAGAMLSICRSFGIQKKLHAVRLFDFVHPTSITDRYVSTTLGRGTNSAKNMLENLSFTEWASPYPGLTELRLAQREKLGVDDLTVRWFQPSAATFIKCAQQVVELYAGVEGDRSSRRSGEKGERLRNSFSPYDGPEYDKMEFRLQTSPRMKLLFETAKNFLDSGITDPKDINDYFDFEVL